MTLEQVAGGFGDGVEKVVLVVSAEAHTQAEIQAAVRPAGHRCHLAPGACVARGVASTRAVNLAVLDADLPDGDALLLGRQLNEEFHIPFVQLAGNDREFQGRAIAAGALSVLLKPVGVAQLGVALDVALVRAREIYRQARLLERRSADFESRKIISVAVGMAMERHGIEEHEALEMVLLAARARQLRLADFCRQFVDSRGASGLLRNLGATVAPRLG